MTKTFGEDLIESMNQALAHAEGKAEDTRVTTIQVPDDLASTERPEAEEDFAKALKDKSKP